MLSIGWVVFWKCVVLTAWATFQEVREDRRKLREKLARAELVARFKREWDRRCAKQPRLLTYRPAPASEEVRAGYGREIKRLLAALRSAEE